MSAVQRLRQGVRAVFAFAQTPDYALAEQFLSPEQRDLFLRLKRSEQLHSLRVLRDVLAQEPDTPDDLALAALLHDTGKTRYPMGVWQKTLAVLTRKFAPTVYARWSRCDAKDPLPRGCVVAENHPAWSAELVAATGASQRALWLIEHHADPAERWSDNPHFHLLKRLKQADDAN